MLDIIWMEHYYLVLTLEKGKLAERRGRKAMGLRPQGYDCQVAGTM